MPLSKATSWLVAWLAISVSTLTVSASQAAFSAPPTLLPSSVAPPIAANFSGQSVYQFRTTSEAQVKQLLSFAATRDFDVWSVHRGSDCSVSSLTVETVYDDSTVGCIDIRMPNTVIVPDFVSKPQVMIDDLEALISTQQYQRTQSIASFPSDNLTWHNNYHTFEEILEFIDHLVDMFPTWVSKLELGKTFEGRPIVALQLGNGQSPSSNKDNDGDGEQTDCYDCQEDPTSTRKPKKHEKIHMVINAGQHAREWVSTSSALFFASQLLHSAQGLKTDNSVPWNRKTAQNILSNFQLTIVPVSNPDGYVYSWETNRMWRKNRNVYNNNNSNESCIGVDLNRNWGHSFETSNHCGESYAGPFFFSEIETQVLSKYISDPINRVNGFIDLHSYGQLVLYPFSHSCKEPVPDEEDLLELALGAVKAINKVHKRVYNVGKSCQLVATSTGVAIDWAYNTRHHHRLKWTFSIQLRDRGVYGFLLPPNQIIQTGQEIGQGLSYLFKFIGKKENV